MRVDGRSAGGPLRLAAIRIGGPNPQRECDRMRGLMRINADLEHRMP